MKKKHYAYIGLGILGTVLLFAPIWRSGLKKMSFAEFVGSHTIFTPGPEYIPLEEYTKPLTEEEIEKLNALHQAGKITETAKEEHHSDIGNPGELRPLYSLR